jgi:hypothetical protein
MNNKLTPVGIVKHDSQLSQGTIKLLTLHAKYLGKDSDTYIKQVGAIIGQARAYKELKEKAKKDPNLSKVSKIERLIKSLKNELCTLDGVALDSLHSIINQSADTLGHKTSQKFINPLNYAHNELDNLHNLLIDTKKLIKNSAPTKVQDWVTSPVVSLASLETTKPSKFNSGSNNKLPAFHCLVKNIYHKEFRHSVGDSAINKAINLAFKTR